MREAQGGLHCCERATRAHAPEVEVERLATPFTELEREPCSLGVEARDDEGDRRLHRRPRREPGRADACRPGRVALRLAATPSETEEELLRVNGRRAAARVPKREH